MASEKFLGKGSTSTPSQDPQETRKKTQTTASVPKKSVSLQGCTPAGWAYFVAWPQTAKDFAQLSQTKLGIPVLAIGGEKSLGDALGQQAKLVSSEATVIVLKDTGHWVMEERPKETMDALLKFL